jgi:hypothetical protein
MKVTARHSFRSRCRENLLPQSDYFLSDLCLQHIRFGRQLAGMARARRNRHQQRDSTSYSLEWQ